jgi:hypothetical protein
MATLDSFPNRKSPGLCAILIGKPAFISKDLTCGEYRVAGSPTPPNAAHWLTKYNTMIIPFFAVMFMERS